MESFGEEENKTINDGFGDGSQFRELFLPLVILIFVIIQIHYFYAPIPEEYQEARLEWRRQRKLLKKEAERQRKLVS